ncbi:MAG: FHA domain-containing protein [Terrimicrobiaceae bacterium]|nr:FHA domain-containing protein [Terrimicrobiaceae bacterium]
MATLQIYLPDGTQTAFDLPEETTTIGRLADNSLSIEDASVSSHHAEIVFEGGAWHLHDLGSTNGTFVNAERTTDAVLRHGDEVRFGAVDTVFQAEEKQSEQPLPASSSAPAQTAHASSRPDLFVSSSPIPKNVQRKDGVGTALIGLAVVAILAAGAAAFMALQLTPPA